MHGELNLDNVMLHYPDIEPTSEELQDPDLFERLVVLQKERA